MQGEVLLLCDHAVGGITATPSGWMSAEWRHLALDATKRHLGGAVRGGFGVVSRTRPSLPPHANRSASRQRNVGPAAGRDVFRRGGTLVNRCQSRSQLAQPSGSPRTQNSRLHARPSVLRWHYGPPRTTALVPLDIEYGRIRNRRGPRVEELWTSDIPLSSPRAPPVTPPRHHPISGQPEQAHGLPSGLPARADDAADRRSPGRAKTGARDAFAIADAAPCHAAHTPLGRPRGRDHRRAGDDRRLRRRPGRRGDPHQQPVAGPSSTRPCSGSSTSSALPPRCAGPDAVGSRP